MRHRGRNLPPLWLAVLLAVSAFAVGLEARAQTSIRVNVSEVVVPVNVRDDEGRFVPGLTVKDFRVFEDGRPQEITDFRSDPVALSVALVIDTGVDQASLDAIVAAIPAMVESFGDFDEVAVFRFNSEVFRMMDFGDAGAPLDRELLRQTLDQLAEFEAGPEFVEPPELQPRVPPAGGAIGDIPSARPARDRPQRVLEDAMLEAVAALRNRSAERRRTIVLVSGGISERSDTEAEEVRLSLLESDIQVYPINLNGGLLPRLMNPFDSYADLGRYADWTGGVAHSANGNDLHEVFSEVSVQARNQYVLTYVSSNPIPPDTIPWREFRVETTGNYRVSYPLGYYQTP